MLCDMHVLSCTSLDKEYSTGNCAYLGFLCVAPPPHVRAVESSLLR